MHRELALLLHLVLWGSMERLMVMGLDSEYAFMSQHLAILTLFKLCSYGLEGYQIILLALEFMFPNDSFDITPFRPLTWHIF